MISCFVWLLISRIAQKLLDGSEPNLAIGSDVGQERTHWTLVWIWIGGGVHNIERYGFFQRFP